MNNDRIHLPCLDEKKKDDRRFYNERQWSKQLKTEYKKNYDKNIRPLIGKGKGRI